MDPPTINGILVGRSNISLPATPNAYALSALLFHSLPNSKTRPHATSPIWYRTNTKSASPKVIAPIAPKRIIMPFPSRNPMMHAQIACAPVLPKRVQFGAWVPADAKVPTTIVIAAAVVIEVDGSIAASPDMPPTSSSERVITQIARTMINGVDTSDTTYIPRYP